MSHTRLLLIVIFLNLGFSQILDVWAPDGDEDRVYSAGETLWISWDLGDDANGDGEVDVPDVEDYEVQMVAATYMAIAMRLYKTNLDEKGFLKMIRTVMETEVEPYEKPKKVLH